MTCLSTESGLSSVVLACFSSFLATTNGERSVVGISRFIPFCFLLALCNLDLQHTQTTMKFASTTVFVALAATASVSAFAPGVTNVRPAVSSNAAVSRQPKSAYISTGRHSVLLQQAIANEEQVFHTAERLAGMSRMEVQHIFEDVDG